MKVICARCRNEYSWWNVNKIKLVVEDKAVAEFVVCETCADILIESFNREVFGEG